MQIQALLTQLGYAVSDSAIEQIKRILNNTDGIEIEQIITLNDHLKPHRCFVAMSGSEDRFKIKNVAQTQEERDEVQEIINNWAKKHKVELKQINETTQYILSRTF